MSAFRLFVRMALSACLAVTLLSMLHGYSEAAPSSDHQSSLDDPDVFPCTITVTSTNDGGPGSLRQAVTDLCDGGLIGFDLSYPAVITLTSEIQINQGLTIQGPGESNLTISGGTVTRVFYVGDTTESMVTISDLTIANGIPADGYTGAGILSYNSTLTVTNITFLNNDAGSLYSGGGLANEVGTVTVIHSTFCNNTASFGGGIYNNGELTVMNSTFSGNRANTGGGIYVPQGRTLTVIDSNFSENTAVSQGGEFTVTGC